MKKTILSLVIFFLWIIPASAFYADVAPEHPYYSSIKTLYDLGRLPEEAENLFHPDEKLLRPDLYKFILTYAQTEITPLADLPYSDTDNNAEYAPYLQTAIDTKLIIPQPNGEFGVTRKVAKHNALSNMFEALGIGTEHFFDKDAFPFIDMGSNSYLSPLANKVAQLGILEKDNPDRFKMAKRITRAEAAHYLYKILKYTNGEAQPPSASASDSNYNETEKKLINNNNFDVLLDIWSRLQDHYYYQNELDDNSLIRGAIKGMVSGLSDKYSVYEEPEDNNVLEILASEYEGIGIVIEIIEGQITIVSPFQDSPAEKAGLKANDIITEVDGENMVGQTLDYASKKIRGPENTTVKLRILREEKEINFTVTRGFILISSVKHQLIEENGKKIAYIKLVNFGESSYTEFVNASKALIKENPTGFIIDLRNNPGGYLDVAVNLIGLFTDEQKTAVILKNADGSSEEYKTDGNGLLKDYKIVIIINEGSASASEIFAGALQDYGKAKIIGTTSFGKGSAQEVRQYSDGSLFKYTISEWSTPNGNEINKKGLTPDKVIEDSDAQLKAAKAEF